MLELCSTGLTVECRAHRQVKRSKVPQSPIMLACCVIPLSDNASNTSLMLIQPQDLHDFQFSLRRARGTMITIAATDIGQGKLYIVSLTPQRGFLV